MKVSVVMPVYNVERYVAESVRSVLSQSHKNLELIIVDDGGTDNSIGICEELADSRTRIIKQNNTGLAGARNTGILNSSGPLVALIDSDDLMLPGKLDAHVAHFFCNPEIGVSYASSVLINEESRDMGIRQVPKAGPVTPEDVFCGKVILNGSVPVFRREMLLKSALTEPSQGRPWCFDETLRRTEDVEAWVRIALRSPMRWEAIPGEYTAYRITDNSLSADVEQQLASWETAIRRIELYAPDFIKQYSGKARAWEMRYLARRCFQMKQPARGLNLMHRALMSYPAMVIKEPKKTLMTLAALTAMRCMPERLISSLTRKVLPGH